MWARMSLRLIRAPVLCIFLLHVPFSLLRSALFLRNYSQRRRCGFPILIGTNYNKYSIWIKGYQGFIEFSCFADGYRLALEINHACSLGVSRHLKRCARDEITVARGCDDDLWPHKEGVNTKESVANGYGNQ